MEEMASRGVVRDTVVRHPEWEGDVPSFDANYEQLFALSYGLRDEQPVIFTYGPASNRRCALCGTSGPDATFKSVSHLMPAALGNRHFFSNEECDNCNSAAGKDQDQELALMLTAHRVLGNVRTRTGTIEVEAGANGAKIGGGAFNGPLKVSKELGDESVLKIEGDTGMLVIPTPAHRPDAAIRSLLRTVWLRFEQPQRDRHATLLGVLKGRLKVAPWEYVEVFIPGGILEKVTLQCWEKRSTSKLPGATLIIRLLFVHSAISWAMPAFEGEVAKCVPSLIPPLLGLGEEQEPRAKVVRIQQTGHLVPAGDSTVTFGFSGISKGDMPEARAKVPAPPGIPVTLKYATASGATFEVGETLLVRTRKPGGSGATVVTIEGGRLAGVIRASPESGRFTFNALVHRTSATDAVRTLDAIHAIATQPGKLVIVPTDSAHDGLEVDLPGTMGVGVHPLRSLLGALTAIEQGYGREFRVPQDPSKLPLDSIMMLGTGISKGRFRREGECSIRLSLPQAEAWRFADADGRDRQVNCSFTFSFLGFETTEQVTVVLKRPTVAAVTNKVGPDGGFVELEVTAESIIYEFDRWIRKP